jgi:hypothetical protein
MQNQVRVPTSEGTSPRGGLVMTIVRQYENLIFRAVDWTPVGIDLSDQCG